MKEKKGSRKWNKTSY